MTLRALPFCLALLSGCASLPPPPPVAAAATSAVQGFALDGRLTLRRGETLHHVGIHWRHDPAADEIFLSGPLGQGLAQITRDGAGARLLTSDRRMIQADDWDGLAERALGVRLPLSGLPRLLAAVAPAASAEVDGWRMDVLETIAGRPVLIELRRDDIEARLKIDQWQP